MAIEESIKILMKFHDASPLKRYGEFCIKPSDFQKNGVPTEEFINSQKLRYALENAITALQEKTKR